MSLVWTLLVHTSLSQTVHNILKYVEIVPQLLKIEIISHIDRNHTNTDNRHHSTVITHTHTLGFTRSTISTRTRHGHQGSSNIPKHVKNKMYCTTRAWRGAYSLLAQERWRQKKIARWDYILASWTEKRKYVNLMTRCPYWTKALVYDERYRSLVYDK